jgi:hypothetical protein
MSYYPVTITNIDLVMTIEIKANSKLVSQSQQLK